MRSRVVAILFLALFNAFAAFATDINGRCYPHPIILGVGGDNASMARAANLEWVRVTFPWRDIQPSPGTWNWGAVEGIVDAHYNAGNKILAILSTAPQWAGSNAHGTYPPGTMSDTSLWKEFVRQTAIHFNGRVAAYEIWNEPNLDDVGNGVGWTGTLFNAGRPTQSPTYARYVKDASTLIRANAPGTRVVAPVTSSRPNAKTVDVFRSLESEGASPYIDIVSFHANGDDDESTSSVWSNITSQLSTLRNRNPSNLNKPIWVTEFGWKTNRVGDNGQRDRIRNIANNLTLQWSSINYPFYCGDIDRTAMAFIYKEIDSSDSSQGIYRMDNSAKPVVTGYLQTLPQYGVQPAAGYNPEGYRPFTKSCTGRTCTFTSGYPQDGLRVYDWDFGDGTTGTGYSVVHTFPANGWYHIYHGALGFDWPSDLQILKIQ